MVIGDIQGVPKKHPSVLECHFDLSSRDSRRAIFWGHTVVFLNSVGVTPP